MNVSVAGASYMSMMSHESSNHCLALTAKCSGRSQVVSAASENDVFPARGVEGVKVSGLAPVK